MPEYEEFRIELTPDLQTVGKWQVRILSCPLHGLAGSAGEVVPNLSREHLRCLRSRNNWPSMATLQEIGRAVWECVMTPTAAAAYNASLQLLAQTGGNKGLRITLAMVGEEPLPLGDDAIRLSELPIEALYNDQHAFVATNLMTPVSRSLQVQADHSPQKVALPLRILVVVSTPGDKPPANSLQEAQAIRDALAPLSGDGGPVLLDFCEPATRAELSKRLVNPYHVLHFIGHGGFDSVDEDPTPRAYLAFRRPDGDTTDYVDANDLNTLLRNSNVRLVVLTACSSAAPIPDEMPVKPYSIKAFDGIAQRLLSGPSAITAVVAMQFDMEAPAAVAFSQAFYQNLLYPGRSLDEVVTLARQALVNTPGFGSGHRAWVNPSVYWRCERGKVFEVDPLQDPLRDPAIAQKLLQIDMPMKIYRKAVEDLSRLAVLSGRDPKTMELVVEYRKEFEDLAKKRGELLGQTVRLWGGVAKAGLETDCRLTLRLRLPHAIDMVQCLVNYPADKLTFTSTSEGINSPGKPVLANTVAPGQLRVICATPSGGQTWQPAEYELGILKFKLADGVLSGMIDLQLSDIVVMEGGQKLVFTCLNGVLFVD